MFTTYAPILIVFVIATGFVATSLIASYFLGPKRHSPTKDSVFECGIESKDNARVRFSVRYFLIAILFVLFDVEVVLFYPWATAFRDLGIPGIIEILGFVGAVVIGIIYLNQNGIFQFEGRHER